MVIATPTLCAQCQHAQPWHGLQRCALAGRTLPAMWHLRAACPLRSSGQPDVAAPMSAPPPAAQLSSEQVRELVERRIERCEACPHYVPPRPTDGVRPSTPAQCALLDCTRCRRALERALRDPLHQGPAPEQCQWPTINVLENRPSRKG